MRRIPRGGVERATDWICPDISGPYAGINEGSAVVVGGGGGGGDYFHSTISITGCSGGSSL